MIFAQRHECTNSRFLSRFPSCPSQHFDYPQPRSQRLVILVAVGVVDSQRKESAEAHSLGKRQQASDQGNRGQPHRHRRSAIAKNRLSGSTGSATDQVNNLRTDVTTTWTGVS